MLRQVSLRLKSENKLQGAAVRNGAKLSVLDCRPFNKTGLSLLLEVKGNLKAVRDAISEIRRVEGVRHAYEGEASQDAVPLMLVLDRPEMCRASSEVAIVCLECPLNSEDQPASWRFIVRNSSDFRHVLARLEREGIETRIEDVAPLGQKATLTGRQREIVSEAVARGYFEFPRKTSLTELSALLGVKPSTLSEILRSAERRIMQNAIGGWNAAEY